MIHYMKTMATGDIYCVQCNKKFLTGEDWDKHVANCSTVDSQNIENSVKQTTPNQLLQECIKTFKNCYEILEKKNKDYAGVIQTNPYANFESSLLLGVSVEKAILIRTLDKIKRISNLLGQEAFVVEESIEDTLNDAINYLAILKARIQYNKTVK